jgi:hypothetical protein
MSERSEHSCLLQKQGTHKYGKAVCALERWFLASGSSGSTRSIPCRLIAFHVHVYVEGADGSTEALLAAAPVDLVTHPPNSMQDTVSECERSGLSKHGTSCLGQKCGSKYQRNGKTLDVLLYHMYLSGRCRHGASVSQH